MYHELFFVYWDISDSDKENYIKNYGEFFFNDTKPVLIVHNETKNYSRGAARYYGLGRRILDLLHWDAQRAYDVFRISAAHRQKVRG